MFFDVKDGFAHSGQKETFFFLPPPLLFLFASPFFSAFWQTYLCKLGMTDMKEWNWKRRGLFIRFLVHISRRRGKEDAMDVCWEATWVVSCLQIFCLPRIDTELGTYVVVLQKNRGEEAAWTITPWTLSLTKAVVSLMSQQAQKENGRQALKSPYCGEAFVCLMNDIFCFWIETAKEAH